MSSSLSNHYLRPEDLSPLPTTLDAKNSPLALLAQTCSNIGADLLPSNKRIIPPIEKCKRSSTERSDSVSSGEKNVSTSDSRSHSVLSTSQDTKISFKPYETNHHINKKVKSDNNYNIVNNSNNNNSNSNNSNNSNINYINNNSNGSRSNSVDVINDSNNKKRSSETKNHSPNQIEPKTSLNNHTQQNQHQQQQQHHHHHQQHHQSQQNNRITPTSVNVNSSTNSLSSSNKSSVSNKSTDNNHKSESSPSLYTSSGLTELSKSQLTALTSKSDSLSTACKTTSSLLSPLNGYNNFQSLSNPNLGLLTNDLLKSSPHYSSLLSPYLNPSMAAHLHSLKGLSNCRDPYCKGCQLSATQGINGNCVNGCNGCTHQLNPYHHLPGAFLPPSLPPFTTQSTGLNSVRPYVCNWTVGGAYCGKNFTTCEELFQHLKSHTSVTGNHFPSAVGNFYNPSALSLGLNTTPRTSVHSSLDALRYHPYKLGSSGGVTGNLPPVLSTPNGPPGHLSLSGAPLGSYYPSYHMYN